MLREWNRSGGEWKGYEDVERRRGLKKGISGYGVEEERERMMCRRFSQVEEDWRRKKT